VESEAELGLDVCVMRNLVFTPAAIRFIDWLGLRRGHLHMGHDGNLPFFNLDDVPLAAAPSKVNEIGDVATATMSTALGDRTVATACNSPKRLANVRATQQDRADLFDIMWRDELLTIPRNFYVAACDLHAAARDQGYYGETEDRYARQHRPNENYAQ
jgi:hypothetical protein